MHRPPPPLPFEEVERFAGHAPAYPEHFGEHPFGRNQFIDLPRPTVDRLAQNVGELVVEGDRAVMIDGAHPSGNQTTH